MKKLTVNQDACIGCGFCFLTYPELFESEDGLSKPKVVKVDDENKDAINAMEGCPTGAIELKEDTEADEKESE